MDLRIEEWRAENGTPEDVEKLAAVLHATVHAGASVSFILPFSMEESRAYWTGRILPSVADGSCRLFVARSSGEIVGTVQLDVATPPNQRHRAEVRKLLVHPSARRRGIARALMIAVEEAARKDGRTLLTLDTRTGDSAEPLYRSLGYETAGVIPNYARGPLGPELEPTTFMYKQLDRAMPNLF